MLDPFGGARTCCNFLTASEGTSPSPAGTGDDTTPNPTTGDNAPLLKYVIIAVAVAAIAALSAGVIIPGSKKNRA